MKKYLNIIIISFLSVICPILLINNVKALEVYNPDTQQMDIVPDLPTIPSGYSSDNYIIVYHANDGYNLILTKPNTTITIRNEYWGDNLGYLDTIYGSQMRFFNIVNGQWSYRYQISNYAYVKYFGTSVNIYDYNDTSQLLYRAGYGLNIPQLTNYTKVTITNDISYLMFSDMSNGAFYMPYNAYQYYYARFSYFNPDLKTQPWSANIENFTYLSDNLIRVEFDLSTYEGAKSILFQACHVDFSDVDCDSFHQYDIYIPNEIYMSNVIITQNEYGSYDYHYTISDSGITSSENYQQIDYGLTSSNPLLGTIFENFSSNTFGLTAIISSPLNLINNITSSSCSSLNIPLPYINSTLQLPCMSTIYQNTFGSFFDIYQLVTFGVISYWVIVKIFNLVKDFKNPDHDEIEVMDL